MAEDQFQSSGGNWWDSAGRNNNSNMRYESGGASQSSSSGISTNTNSNFANWHQQDHPHPHDHDHVAAAVRRSSMEDDAGQHGGSSVVFHHHQQHPDPNLHMMGLGLSSPSSLDWDQPPSFLRGEKGGAENSSSLRCMVQQENLGSSRTNNYQQQFSPGDSTVTSQQGSGFHHNIESSALYGSPSSILMQGLLLGPPPPDPTNTNLQHFPFPSMTYGLMTSNASATDLVPPAAPAQQQLFFRGSAPPNNHNHLLHFTNNAPFWNASEAASPTIKHLRSTAFFPSSLQPPFSTSPPNLDSMCEVRESGGAVKKSGSEQTAKRPRNETPSPLPAFKVRKEKMGDRITALQQLVSPFGKTDTASVLSEAIEYIKFLHEQVTVLSTPYMKSGAPIQIQQSSGKCKEGGEGPKQDLRSRGLCLVPVSSTFPVTHETTVDFWTPTFGGGSR